MVNMIAIQRSYEANQKVMQAHDAALEKAVNEVGRL
jgi:flagellar basal-body rod protein FlgG